ncbi:unnamed protein product [Mytilus edulis]|uniref:Novel STAND NTPase 3 domain-containing protein n=1 Tax=Mytilus edulis TaxID=6550 RepID=A0A8S3VFP5_MYTED|nr:unnamed protein product [Mytilus edulis]
MEIENERFKKTKVVDDILLSLKKTNCITITGMPGEGKTALMHHVALVLHKTAQFSIVPCSVATDINHFYKKDKNQIFVIDDVCGKYIIDQYLVNSFIYNESFHRLILKKGNSKFISTCRKQIFQEKKFQQLQYLIGKAFDISTDYPMSDEEKLLIANEYLSPNAVKRIQVDLFVRKYINDLKDENVLTAFNMACIGGHISIVRSFIEYGIEVNTNDDKHGWTPLMHTCQAGADVNLSFQDNITKIEHNFKLLTSTLCAENDERFEAQDDVAKLGHNLKLMTSRIFGEIDKTSEATNNGWTSLHIASEKGHRKIAELLIKKSAKINKVNGQGLTSLMLACKNGHQEIVQLLLSFDCDINKREYRGRSALTYACYCNKTQIAMMLMSKKSRQRRKDTSQCCIIFGHTTTIDLLFAKGASVDQYDTTGCTPLMSACQRKLVSVVEKLLANEANPNHSSTDGNTPVTTVCKNGKLDILNNLVHVGADLEKVDKKGKLL